VHVYQGVVYAFRDNVAGTACIMWKATAAGWVQVTTPALLAGGTYSFVNYNFTGAAGTAFMYGCDGVNKAFQFDGTTFTPITTGMVNDTPTHIAAHKKHLFLAFAGGSVQHSAIGDPLTWSPVLGAGEIALGDECTGFEQQAGDAMAIFTRNQTHMLYGTSAIDWNLRPFSRTTGCFPSTHERINNSTYYLDDRGVASLQSTQAFGDFISDSISQTIAPFVSAIKIGLTTSVQVRNKSQYRLFSSTGDGLVASFSGSQFYGWTTVAFPNPVICAVSGNDSVGNEVVYFGSDNGFVYQMEKGTSFDGLPVEASLQLHYNHERSPRTRKRYRRVLVEQEGTSLNTPIVFQVEFDGGANTSGQGNPNQVVINSGRAYWNASHWNQFNWSSDNPTAMHAVTDGTAKNIGIIIYSSLTYELPYKLTGALIHFEPRRTERGD